MRARTWAVLLATAIASLATTAGAEGALPPAAIFAGHPLPAGAVSVFGTLGYPGLEVGFRQGLGGMELGAVAGFDYSLTQLNLDVPFSFPIVRSRNTVIGLGLSVGGFVDFGASYIQSTNLSSAGLRFSALGELTQRVTENLDLFALATTPFELALSTQGNNRYAFEVGGGAELGVGDGFTVGAQLLLGPELLYARHGGDNSTRVDVSVLAGLGKRFF